LLDRERRYPLFDLLETGALSIPSAMKIHHGGRRRTTEGHGEEKMALRAKHAMGLDLVAPFFLAPWPSVSLASSSVVNRKEEVDESAVRPRIDGCRQQSI
jgi:hypothetical protein